LIFIYFNSCLAQRPNYDSIFYNMNLDTLFSWVEHTASKPEFALRNDLVKLRRRWSRGTAEKKIDLIFDPLSLSGNFSLNFLIPVIKDNPDFQLNLLYHFNETNLYATPDSTLEEIKVQIAITEYFKVDLFEYLIERGRRLKDDNWENVAFNIGLDTAKIYSIISSDGIDLLLKNNFSEMKKIKEEEKHNEKYWNGNRAVFKTGWALINSLDYFIKYGN